MTKDDKNRAIILSIGYLLVILYFFLDTVISPYIAVKKANQNDFKMTCAYVTGKEKDKYVFNYLIWIDDKEYKDREILPLSTFGVKKSELNNFPIRNKQRYFFKIEPNECKKVSYIEIYNFWGFKKFYLYDFIN